ncbi:hypothetical protein AMATHDRAFT_52860 [Amanita thiersii Skay4041]|uniref:Oxidoreductase n=1 Tax=Amanita thiersii Skay4041 TaxID=703135 RepID=A0A2A9NWA2_9AGAR|nr:hypothetical protein AMATHDRAFT_52860 [Amanita thiersii Skay4041]
MTPVVLVTGCSTGGIGHALCEEFAKSGCIVYATSRNPATIGKFENKNITALALDVTKDDDIHAVVHHLLEAEKRIDVLVNNAGGICPGPLLDQDIDKVKQTFDTNTFGVLRMVKAVLPEMAKRRNGLIINIGSVVGEVPTPWNGIYSASKAALYSLSEVLNMECRPFGVSVMHVAPGSVKSNIADNAVAQYQLPSDSLYKTFLPNIMHRIYVSQGPRAMPTHDFARVIVSKALSKNPPAYTMIGGYAALFTFLKWLPRALVLLIMWRTYSRKL